LTLAPRLSSLLDAATREGASGVLLTFLPDIRWACGFTGSNGLLLVLPEGAWLFTDGRYAAQVKREVQGATPEVVSGDLIAGLAAAALLTVGMRVNVQAEHLTLAQLRALNAAMPGVEWVETEGLLPPLVAVKTPEEVARIEAAQRVTEAVFEDVIAQIRAGITEKDVAAEIVYGHLRRGAERMAFEPIVASGSNGALPHARPTDRPLRAGDLVVLDFGGVLDGYASDMTRTVAVGEPGEEARRVHAAVREAQEAAIGAARAGIRTDELDAAARDVLRRHGLGEAFMHGLGHGIGLQTHEWPRVSYQRQDTLPPGCAITIEPGAYLEGRFGVRIEDIVVLHADGCRNLTRAPKELIVL
jgi:Xaa-Pro aminopeptidase